MGKTTFRIGPIRPPSEANSLLLQVTNGCTWNRCKFCQLYRHTKFRAYSADSIKADIDNMVKLAERIRRYRTEGPGVNATSGTAGGWDISGINHEIMNIASDEERQCYYMMANWLLSGGENVFLQDGNTTVLSSGRLTDVLKYLREAFPSIRRITSYGRAENLSKVSAEEFAELKAAGLDRIHSGYESGSDEVLKLINKGTTQEQEIIAGRNIKKGGIELSVYFMPGVGGKALSQENAEGMAYVLNQVNPDFIRIRTAAVKPGTELHEDFIAGKFRLASEDDKVGEIRRVIELSQGIETMLVSDHIVNLLQNVEGSLADAKPPSELGDKARMLEMIDTYLNLSDEERRRYQFARRRAWVSTPEQMERLSEGRLMKLESFIGSMTDASGNIDNEAWEIKMNEIICRFI